ARAATERASRAVKEKTVFARLIGNESPENVVAASLRGATPARDMSQMAKIAKKSGPAAVNGLKISVIDAARSNATTASGVDFARFRDFMFSPPARGQPTPAALLLRNNLSSAEEIGRLN